MKAFFAFGRMNPPTAGHLRVIERLREEAEREGRVVRLYLSQSHDKKRNPLTPEQKIDFIKRIFPDVDVRLSKTMFTAALEMSEEGIEEGVMIVGEDRQEEFSKILSAYAGTEFLGLKQAEVKAISRNETDASSTAARAAAETGDWDLFCKISATDDESLTREIYEAVRYGLGV